VRRCFVRRCSTLALGAVLALAVAPATLAWHKKAPGKERADDRDVMTGAALPGLEHIDRALLESLAANRIPGASLAIARKGRLVLAAATATPTSRPAGR
jgi:hypothetical protein